jgi:hypothetical protein
MTAKVTCDPRADLERLPSEQLYTIARNESATHKALALRILIERGSEFALQPEVAEEARELILNDPVILKKSNPACGVTALSMPGVLDVLADNQVKRAELAELVDQNHATSTRSLAALESTVSRNHAANLEALNDETDNLEQQFVQRHAQLKQTVAQLGHAVVANKELSDQAVREACATLWKYILKQAWQVAEDAAAQRIAFNTQLADLQGEFARYTQAATERLRLLERSPWRKVLDWLHARWLGLRKSDLNKP